MDDSCLPALIPAWMSLSPFFNGLFSTLSCPHAFTLVFAPQHNIRRVRGRCYIRQSSSHPSDALSNEGFVASDHRISNRTGSLGTFVIGTTRGHHPIYIGKESQTKRRKHQGRFQGIVTQEFAFSYRKISLPFMGFSIL